jgi:hypothetical protein
MSMWSAHQVSRDAHRSRTALPAGVVWGSGDAQSEQVAQLLFGDPGHVQLGQGRVVGHGVPQLGQLFAAQVLPGCAAAAA